MSTPRPEDEATVWSSTFIPVASPLSGYGADGFSVAWVDTATDRRQVLVDGPRPAPGTAGRLVPRTFDDQVVEIFTAVHP